jgi:hypothetical protein
MVIAIGEDFSSAAVNSARLKLSDRETMVIRLISMWVGQNSYDFLILSY